MKVVNASSYAILHLLLRFQHQENSIRIARNATCHVSEASLQLDFLYTLPPSDSCRCRRLMSCENLKGHPQAACCLFLQFHQSGYWMPLRNIHRPTQYFNGHAAGSSGHVSAAGKQSAFLKFIMYSMNCASCRVDTVCEGVCIAWRRPMADLADVASFHLQTAFALL